MVKKLLTRVVDALPESARCQVRERYWRVKSRFLYQSLYSLLNLEQFSAFNVALQEIDLGLCDTHKCLGMLKSLGFQQTILRTNDSCSVSLHIRS
jgi:hypothetical protein